MTTLSELITTLKGKMLPLTGGTLSGNLEIGGNATVSGKNIVRSINGTVAGTDGNVDLNNISGNAASATKLQTSRTIAISGGATGTATGFNGTANITIPVTALDVSKATAGTLATGRGGTGRTDGKVTALATTRYLDGVGFTGAADVSHYGTCSTEAATVEKVVACSNFALKTGSRIIVRFTVTNTAASPTLNVNSTGAKNIRYRNSNISAGYLAANRTYEFVYDGSYYQVVGDIDTNTTYSKASNAEAIAGTNDTKYMTPLRVKEAVAKFAPVKTVNGNSPNSDGNVTLNVSMDPLVAYPVGSIYMSVNATNPSQLFGGTWEAIAGGRVLIGQNTSYPAGSTGGEATHKLTIKEMPSHTHSGSSSSAGSHSHTRGTQEITGWFSLGNNVQAAYIDGKVFQRKEALGGKAADAANDSSKIQMYASKGWSGSTSSAGSHSHSMSLDNTGGSSAHNNMQPYLSVYMWKRTA